MRSRLFFLLLLVAPFLRGADGFLFVTFMGEQSPMTEQIYFAVSEDGRDWQALNKSEPVLVSEIGEKGARDPYVMRSPDGKKFYLLATDLSINRNPDWKRAVQAGSHSLLIWESADLVNWSAPRLANVAADDAGCAWAPEAVYDEASEDFLVFWASTTARDDFKKHRIWATRTKDFHTFSAPFIYIEKAGHIIDTTIVRDSDRYYRFTKDEEFKAITMESANALTGPWKVQTDFSLSRLVGYEGPECYLVHPGTSTEPPTWCLILDFYSKSQGYQPFTTHDLASGKFEPAEGFKFPFKFRHGSVLPISKAELQRLRTAYGAESSTP